LKRALLCTADEPMTGMQTCLAKGLSCNRQTRTVRIVGRGAVMYSDQVWDSNLLAALMSIVVTAVVHGVSFRQLSCAKGLLEQWLMLQEDTWRAGPPALEIHHQCSEEINLQNTYISTSHFLYIYQHMLCWDCSSDDSYPVCFPFYVLRGLVHEHALADWQRALRLRYWQIHMGIAVLPWGCMCWLG